MKRTIADHVALWEGGLLGNRCLAFPFLVTSDINQKMEKHWDSYGKLGKGTIQMLEFLLITGHRGLFKKVNQN